MFSNHHIALCQIPSSDIGQTWTTFDIDILQQNTINVTTAVAIMTSIGKLVSSLFIWGPGVHYLLVNTCFDTSGVLSMFEPDLRLDVGLNAEEEGSGRDKKCQDSK